MIDLSAYEVWFVTGSQHLYGNETLEKVALHSQEIAAALSEAQTVPVRVVGKPVLTTPDAITQVCREANAATNCIGVIAWMHTFSPAKMWIAGLRTLTKPLAHLHTQYGRDLPWASIDMDFMNLHQSAHGDREFGFIGARLRLNRKVIAGHWRDETVLQQLGGWVRAAAGWHDSQDLKVARFGDNMREVAVTEGNKVSAQIQFGYSVNGYGVSELVKAMQGISDAEVDRLASEYDATYDVAAVLRSNGDRRASLRDAVRIELGLRAFLTSGGFHAFTDTFQDLHGLPQLPGVAVQRLMSEGYGFGAEGDWKTAALVRTMKVISHGLDGGTSFMEDYTYHLGQEQKVLGAHMLEICPSISGEKPRLEIHPLSIGGKADPVRLVFTSRTGPAINASLMDLGNRFRLLVNEVDVSAPDAPLPRLPVARAIWKPRPSFDVACAAWIYAGGAHHTGFSLALNSGHMEDFADMAGIEFLLIDDRTDLRTFRNELRWNETAFS